MGLGTGLSVCAGRRCWRHGAGLLLATAQSLAPRGTAVYTVGCCGSCPANAVLVCCGPSSFGGPVEVEVQDARQAAQRAAELLIRHVGAGEPRASLPPSELPPLLMRALQFNDFPVVDAGLQSMWAFAGGGTRFMFNHSLTEFTLSAHETADTYPTSFYGAAFARALMGVRGGAVSGGWG